MTPLGEVVLRSRRSADCPVEGAPGILVVLVQSEAWTTRSRGGLPDAPDRCCHCYLPAPASAPRLRTAQTRDGERWIAAPGVDLAGPAWVRHRDDLVDEDPLVVLPVTFDCLRRHPEWRHGLVEAPPRTTSARRTSATYEVRLPDDSVYARTSRRSYTHAIARRDGARWSVTSLCGSLVLAEREAATQQRLSQRPSRWNPADEWQILPAAARDDSGVERSGSEPRPPARGEGASR